jgi:hypothetical protein
LADVSPYSYSTCLLDRLGLFHLSAD